MASVTSPLDSLSEAEYKKRVRAWTLYDWANSAFATTILAAVLPVYYSQVAGSTLSSAAKATQYWSITLSISVFAVAIMSPILGTVSDIMRGKKKFLSVFIAIGVIGTGLLMLIDTGDWFLASLFFVIGRIGFGAANVFYDSLLPHVAKEEDADKISTQGYALGYLGGGILLAINIVMIQLLPGTWGVRWSFLTVAIWWALFSLPILLQVPEPPGGDGKLEEGENLFTVGFKRIGHTIRNIRSYDDLFKFLIAFLIYNDGIGIIISVAAIYGAELGFGSTDLILAILLVQFVGIPYSLVFGNLPNKANPRQALFVGFIIFNIIMLPLTSIAGKFLFPQTMTGRPSPDFPTVGEFVGQGEHTASAFGLDGSWATATISSDQRGVGCSWYAFWCDNADFDADYAITSNPNARIDIPYNGQKIELTYASGPDNGLWAVQLDGQPLIEADEPVVIDAYNETIRYDVTREFDAQAEGTHTLTLINQSASDGGTNMSISAVDVLQPVRDSSLGAIIGLLAALQLVGLALAYVARPLFKGIAERLDTKTSIMLALSAYAIIAVWGYWLDSVIEFWFLAWMVAVVQGGSQALSRSLYAAMTPTQMSGEFFGFFSIMSKFASFLSPLVFVVTIAIFGSSRPGVLSLIVFFLVGMYLLTKVDVEEGKRVAKAKDAELANA